jgi:hypothetical protein
MDPASNRKIKRSWVVTLQEKVLALEAELAQYTDDDYPRTNEDIVRPGGMVRLDASDETTRYLGPSSGIAMTRLLLEEAKLYAETNRISDIIPEVNARRQARMQSVQMTGSSQSAGKKSYPMISEHPAMGLPSREIAQGLVHAFFEKGQLFWPVLHEQTFQKDFEAVYENDPDPYKKFVVHMVIAISLQKIESQYAGLGDSYYLAAMQFFIDVIQPKDLRTLQCLVLVGQYSLLTPTRTPVYYVLGLAARICHIEGLTQEATITAGLDSDPLTVDMRRRLVWAVAGMELGLAHSMGRPSSFGNGDGGMNVNFFATVDDEHITEGGIQNGPPSNRKLVAIHFYKMRMHQSEIRSSLYENERPEPRDDSHPWFEYTEQRLKEWLDNVPEFPKCKDWFMSRYHQMRIFLYRPSPQVTKPSPRAAKICFESAASVINLSDAQLGSALEEITWVFVLMLNMSLNTLLWATSYPEVRHSHAKEEVEELVDKSLNMLEKSAERWPGSTSASQLYAVLSKACLQSYEARSMSEPPSRNSFATPLSIVGSRASPEGFPPPASTQSMQYHEPPSFAHVFNSPPESMNNYPFDPRFPPPQPTFRSNSIFRNPGTDALGRRFSYFPPDFNNSGDLLLEENTPPMSTPDQPFTSPPGSIINLSTPPESSQLGGLSVGTPSSTMSPPNAPPSIGRASPVPTIHAMQASVSPPPKAMQPQPPQRAPTFTVAPTTHPAPQQRPLPVPATRGDWFAPPPPLISPYNLGSMNNNYYFNDMTGGASFADPSSGNGLQSFDAFSHLNYPTGRQGSLTQSQQTELMTVLETQGMGDIDAFLASASWD